jgi:hypothetical protein
MMKKTWIAVIAITLMLVGSSVAWAEGRYRTIEVFFDAIHFAINGQELPVRDDSLIYNGSVYVPIRALTEMLGAKVGWNDASRTVTLNFIADANAAGELEAASKKGIYQYIAFENNQIMSSMIEHFQKNDMDGMKEDIEKYSDLRNYALALKDNDLFTILDKLATSGEIVRSGLSSKTLDDFSLAWSIFNANEKSLITLLNAKLSQPASTPAIDFMTGR